jgi:peptidoglycan/LPS O-acetylase OafA/YrhL
LRGLYVSTIYLAWDIAGSSATLVVLVVFVQTRLPHQPVRARAVPASENRSISRLGYRPELDGLRGVAILLVLLIHVTNWPRGGLLGVDMFFTLSGFLITTLLLEEWEAHGSISLGKFYVRRYFRLFPALAVLIAVYVLFVLVFGKGNIGLRLSGAGYGITYVSNWVMAFNGPYPEWEIGHLWSLAVEEQFYLVWPALLVLLLKRGFGLKGTKWVLATIIAAVVVWRSFLDLHGVDDSRLYFGTDTRFDQLLVGCMAGTLYVSGRTQQRIRFSKPLMIAATVAVGFLFWRFFVGNLQSSWSFTIGFTLFGVATAVTIYACVTESIPWLKRLLSAKALVFLGTISYSLYLWHVAASVFMKDFLEIDRWIAVVVQIALALVAACASYYLIELPFLRRRKAYERLRSTKVDTEEARSRLAPRKAAPHQPRFISRGSRQ